MNSETSKLTTEGHLHPLTTAIREVQTIFEKIGFEVAEGPEVEDEYHNFDVLNMPADHPARDMQDTFWLKATKEERKKAEESGIPLVRKVLRTQTSGVQVRFMEHNKPPFRIIVPGRVFRNEATDRTHEAQFYQVEGMYIDKEVSLATLKGTLEYFYKSFFGPDAEIRFRPSFFPFVEPAVEVDVKYKGKWLEVTGAGMVHPHVLRAGGLNPDEWQGFAFGAGLDRLLMIKYGIDDIRHLYNGDMRFINQF